MLDSGIKHLHFYTMNLERATIMVLEDLGILPEYVPEAKTPPKLPWRQSLALGRQEESVRPIFWKNRKQSYVTRTQDWDEFPNGRWGDSRSPAYGELETYGVVLKHTSAKAIELWGNPATVEDLGTLFADYIGGKVKSLPWSDAPISAEVKSITDQLIDLNKRNILTINSQPAVNGVRSNDPVHGWGPSNGYVYQKAYLEVLVSPSVIGKLTDAMNSDPDVTYYLVNKKGHLKTNSPVDSPNAVTWGIYPGKEVIQPTIVEKISFLAWKDEAFRLGDEWANCYKEDAPSNKLIKEIADNWYLINIVHNDFHRPYAIFDLFNNL
jgi:methylenetetrahydrofolate reductase (NADPH)